MPQDSSVRLEVGSGTTFKGGSLTFVFPRVNCPDFTWYICRASGSQDGTSIDSTNTTLQISPGFDSLMKTSPSDLVVNQISSFLCRGTVRKEGPFSLQWYRRTITSSSQLQVDPAKVVGQNECSRSISSSINYNVSETDGPNLVLWCRIESGQRIDKMVNFTVQEISTIAAPFTPQPVKAGLEPGSIVGIVLGVIAIIVLVVLLVWFLVVRPKRLKAAGSSKDKGPEPNAKDYQVQDNVLYATVDPLKKQNHKSSSSSLVQGPDTNSNSVQDTGTAAKKLKSNKQNAFLPSRGDATDNMDEAYELPPPPPPPPPKPHRSPLVEGSNPLHYAELELAVQKSAKRRSEYGQRPNTDYAVITHS
ncbi:unnamed protein product [Acanthosepion pharaonis]|uniref:Ig-like domain-containing protein n=1 Tax=Acanthosepion pharaonis TaxID=158019 RepID=A0A812E4R2_ACAPH|nr:unnamed protein product [Sepia pharaonis]